MKYAVLAALVPSVLTAAALAQSTAFTYQGRLKNGAQPASGLHDFRFRLFDAATGGTQIGAPQCVDNILVTDGVFTATIDFGQQFATPDPRFLEIEVRVDTGLNCSNATGLVLLAPRQTLTAAPMASHARSAFTLDAADGSPANAVFVDNAGNVGIRTTSPQQALHVNGGLLWGGTTSTVRSDQDGLGLFFEQRGISPATSPIRLQTSRAGDVTNYSQFFIDPSAGFSFMSLGTGNRNVGIGTSTPVTSLHVNGQSLWLTGGNGGGLPQFTAGRGLRLYYDAAADVAQIFAFNYLNATPRHICLQDLPGANVGIGTTSPAAKLHVNGTTRTTVLEITGADLAEKFPASEELKPGMVVAIDRHNPGQLCLARGAYNRCVAGVVSGANNFAAGAVLGNLPGHEDAPPIALSGRVYVQCDTSGGPIEPGDLLTTSDNPGHAMKATDRQLSHGAVIGKAMERLETGRGLVLVLVNLQ